MLNPYNDFCLKLLVKEWANSFKLGYREDEPDELGNRQRTLQPKGKEPQCIHKPRLSTEYQYEYCFHDSTKDE
jgi:hypothetical protein